jgi:hypothetical protein
VQKGLKALSKTLSSNPSTAPQMRRKDNLIENWMKIITDSFRGEMHLQKQR